MVYSEEVHILIISVDLMTLICWSTKHITYIRLNTIVFVLISRGNNQT